MAATSQGCSFFDCWRAEYVADLDQGTEPAWAPDGRILFYRSGYQMMAVDIALEPSFLPGTPQLLFERPYHKAL